MCRTYETASGSYVRLCYRHGARRGEHVPGRLEQPGCWPRTRSPRLTGGRAAGSRERIRRCSLCSMSTRQQICSTCRKEAERWGVAPEELDKPGATYASTIGSRIAARTLRVERSLGKVLRSDPAREGALAAAALVFDQYATPVAQIAEIITTDTDVTDL